MLSAQYNQNLFKLGGFNSLASISTFQLVVYHCPPLTR